MSRLRLAALGLTVIILIGAGQVYRATRPPTLNERLEAIRPELIKTPEHEDTA